MSIDERLANTDFPLPAIRQVNMAKHETSISLGLGELKEFSVDDKIVQAVSESMQTSGPNYTANAGLPLLRKAVAANQQEIDGFEYNENHVVITIGVQNAMYAAIKTLSKLGAKRVLIPEIYFGIYKKIPSGFNLEVVTYKLSSDFGIEINALEQTLKSDDVVIINSPSNPTGRVFSDEEQHDLASLLKAKLTKGYVISDEIYSKLVYDGDPYKSFSKFFSRTIVLDGISKSAAAAGLRVGWIITQNEKMAKAFTSNNASIISCPPTVNQYAALPVVNGETEQTIKKYQQALKQNRDIVAHYLDKAGISYVLPKGSFYIFPEIGDKIKGTVKDFCIATAQKENGVVVIPGEAFGATDHIRISLASTKINEGMERLIKEINACSIF